MCECFKDNKWVQKLHSGTSFADRKDVDFVCSVGHDSEFKGLSRGTCGANHVLVGS